MKIMIFSDIHGDLRALERALEQPADIYISAGDLSTFGKGIKRCGALLARLGDRAWILPGNHESHADAQAFCREFGLVDFHRQVRKVGTTVWAGLGYSNLTPFNTPGEYTEDEIAQALGEFDSLKEFYLAVHVPPFDTLLDRYAPGKHGGSPALREWVERHRPLGLYCGHIHETAGMTDRVGTTPCFNVGKVGRVVEV
jgi:Icc-related predicted phosphoesterase